MFFGGMFTYVFFSFRCTPLGAAAGVVLLPHPHQHANSKLLTFTFSSCGDYETTVDSVFRELDRRVKSTGECEEYHMVGERR